MSVSSRVRWLIVYAGVVAIGAFQPLAALIRLSRADDTASHVVLIPVIAAGLVYYSRDRILTSVSWAFREGSAVVVVGLLMMLAGAMQWIGGADQSFRLMIAAVVVLWIGGFVCIFGTRASRAALFPLGFLFLMIPIPATPLQAAVAFLKEGSAATAAGLFTITGTTFHREAFTFTLPKFTIEVADQCSGIRSSLALTITALIAGHMFLASAWKKSLLVLFVLPVAVLKNAVRIVSLCLLASYVDPGFLAGRLHHDGGFVFFGMALALLAPVLVLLSRSDAGSDQPLGTPQTHSHSFGNHKG